MSRVLSIAALTVALLLALGGVAFADAEVTIGDDGLAPETVRVDIREAIVWTNATDADVSLVGQGPDWESGPIEPGATFSIEITKAGTYEYESADGELAGEIIVGAAEAKPSEGAQPDEGAQEATEPPVEEVDPDEENMPNTGINAAVPGALSLLLIGFGGGLLQVTDRPRRRRRR